MIEVEVQPLPVYMNCCDVYDVVIACVLGIAGVVVVKIVVIVAGVVAGVFFIVVVLL